MTSHGEDTLPASNRVGAHDWMDGLELRADVLGGTARLVVELEAIAFSCLLKPGLFEGDCKAFKKLLIGLADLVVDVIARRPECIYRRLHQG
jgi:hypothetical protein